jgi:hypothetical protein
MKKFVLKKNSGPRPNPKPKKQQQQTLVIETAKPKRNRQRKRNKNKGIRQLDVIDRMPRGVPQPNNRRRQIVAEDEYIGEVSVANQPNFNVAFSLPINPGQASTFPWLSSVAKNYEKYRFLKLEFYYKPEVTQYTTGVNTGKVIVMCDYDASDPAPNSKQNMEDTEPHCDGMPYQTLSLRLSTYELHQNSVAKFVRPGGVPGGSDIKTYDAGTLFVATQAQTANATLGELRVRYVVELSVPVLELGNGAPTCYTTTYGTVTFNPPTSVLTYCEFTYDTNGLGITDDGAGTMTLPVGNYFVSFHCSFLASAAVLSTCTGYALSSSTTIQTYKHGGYTGGVLVQDMNLSGSFFFSSDGTSTLAFPVTPVFGSGSLQVIATVVIHSV